METLQIEITMRIMDKQLMVVSKLLEQNDKLKVNEQRRKQKI